MQLFIRKVQSGEIPNATLRTGCSAEALDQAKQKIQSLHCQLPAEYVDFLALHNGFQGADDITVYYVADASSSEEVLKNPKAPTELIQANEVYHSRGLNPLWLVLGECDLGLFVYDSEAKEYVIIDPSGFDEFDGYDSLEDMIMDMIDPEYFGEEESEDDEEDDDEDEE